MITIFIVALLYQVIAIRANLVRASTEAVTKLTTSQINAFTPYTYFTKAVYCDPSKTLSWTSACDANGDFIPVTSGGDGNAVQYWYVGYDQGLDTVVVAHQGTNPFEFLADLTDLDIFLGSLDSSLFPGLPSDIAVHEGFRNEQARTASDILASVELTMSKYKATTVTMVGHSLGAAIALLDSVYLPLHLSSETKFQAFLYGLPRVGNQAFANYVDEHLTITHINNLKDPVPIVPDMWLGYVHPSGEVHITKSGEWVACSGQDNPNVECIVGDEPNIFSADIGNHNGPYNGIEMPCSA